jgi:hypothetical protein
VDGLVAVGVVAAVATITAALIPVIGRVFTKPPEVQTQVTVDDRLMAERMQRLWKALDRIEDSLTEILRRR